jgi:uncharacterized membrane protein
VKESINKAEGIAANAIQLIENLRLCLGLTSQNYMPSAHTQIVVQELAVAGGLRRV